MKKAVVLFAPGFEESEALTIVDILRRAEIICDMAGSDTTVVGAHQIEVRCNKTFDEIAASPAEYDMIILPGGLPGAANLRDNETVIHLLQQANEAGSFLAAICAAPIVLEKAGLLENKHYTAYVGYDKEITSGTYQTDLVVRDGTIITSRGPATVYAFAYALVDALGGDSLAVKNRMVYFNAFEEEKAHE